MAEKPIIALITLMFLLTACKHENFHLAPAERRITSAAEIHQKIPGIWTLAPDFAHGYGFHTFHTIQFDIDGRFVAAKSNETLHAIGTWRLQEGSEEVTNALGKITEMRPAQDKGSC